MEDVKVKVKEWLRIGNGSGISSILGKDVYQIDEVPTIVEHIRENVARGFILNEDFTLNPCFIAKGNGYFAHGKTIKDARDALREKIFENMDSEEAIENFLKTFEKGKEYPGTQFFEWHHYLTGSCQMGRESFVKNKGIKLEDTFTVDRFIELCEDDYGSEIIKKLKERWN